MVGYLWYKFDFLYLIYTFLGARAPLEIARVKKQERLPSSKLGPCASVWGQPSHYLFISLAWHSSASACFHYSIHHVFVSLKSDLQAEIWLSIVDLSPIITLLQSIVFFLPSSVPVKYNFTETCIIITVRQSTLPTRVD